MGPVKAARTRGDEAAFERFDVARRFDLRDRVHPVAVADSPDAYSMRLHSLAAKLKLQCTGVVGWLRCW